MDTQEKMLRELISLTKENREMLRAINSQRRLSNIFFVIRWAIIIALAYGAYQAAVPFVQSAQNTINQINVMTNDPLGNIQNTFLNQFKPAPKN